MVVNSNSKFLRPPVAVIDPHEDGPSHTVPLWALQRRHQTPRIPTIQDANSLARNIRELSNESLCILAYQGVSFNPVMPKLGRVVPP